MDLIIIGCLLAGMIYMALPFGVYYNLYDWFFKIAGCYAIIAVITRYLTGGVTWNF
jgi:hypothetical protein